MRNAFVALSLSAALFGAACERGGHTGIAPSPLPLGATGASSAATGSNLAASADGHVAVPFRADFIITPQLLAPGDPDFPARCPTGPTNAVAIATGVGQAKHLGKITEVESACIDFGTLQLTLGEFTLTAANGDQLWGEFEGSASFDPPPPNALLQCTFTLTGGTGRFDDASGSGECADSRQLGNGTSHIVFDGWITYDASNRTYERAPRVKTHVQ